VGKEDFTCACQNTLDWIGLSRRLSAYVGWLHLRVALRRATSALDRNEDEVLTGGVKNAIRLVYRMVQTRFRRLDPFTREVSIGLLTDGRMKAHTHNSSSSAVRITASRYLRVTVTTAARRRRRRRRRFARVLLLSSVHVKQNVDDTSRNWYSAVHIAYYYIKSASLIYYRPAEDKAVYFTRELYCRPWYTNLMNWTHR